MNPLQRPRQWIRRFALGVVLLCVFNPSASFAAQKATYEELTGWLTVVWGDGPADKSQKGPILIRVQNEQRSQQIEFSDEFLQMTGGLAAVNGRQVRVWLLPPEEKGESQNRDADQIDAPRRAAALQVIDDAALPPAEPGQGGPTESHPWISILCKFADIADEPKALPFFQGMYANAVGGLDHYWQEVSYNAIDIAGSTAVDWQVLPRNQDQYTPVPGAGCFEGTGTNLGLLVAECTAAADPFVDYSLGGTGGFAGINQMFNSDLDGCAWGGGWFLTLDGVSKVWSVTWEPPWGYQNVTVMAHEMGHGFGLPHANNADGDSSPYDNAWDVMSDAWGFTVLDGTYGLRGKHVNSYHKNRLGWIPANQRLITIADGIWTIIIDESNLATTANYRMAVIPIPGGSRFYTVEVRDQSGNYDGNLPGNAVIIHEVDESRSEPSWLVDPIDPDNSADEGAMWRVGETFSDAANNIRVEIISATTDGFEVTIRTDDFDLLFRNSFE